MAIDKNIPPFLAHSDGNQTFSIVGVVGTMGTSDTGGTARVLPVGVNPDTGAMYVQDLSGAAGTTNVQIVGGTFNAGTVTTTLALNTGTITTIAAGTQNTLGTVGTVIGIGTLTGIGALPAHAISLGTVLGPNAVAGTSTTAPVQVGGTTSTGTVYGMLVDTAGNPQVDVVSAPQVSVGTVPQVSIGTLPTLNLATGTITTGSLSNLAMLNAGTVVVSTIPQVSIGTLPVLNLTTGTITTGSLTNLAGLHTGTITTGSITDVAKLYNGSVNVLTGTIQSSGTVTGVGVVTSLTSQSAGTLNTLGTVGVVNNLAGGTVKLNATPAGSTIISTHVLGTGGGTFFGTILASAGAGTNVYVAGLSIVCHSGTVDCGIANNVAGTTGAGVLARGLFSPGGGIARDFNPAINIGAAGTIAYFLISAGTVSLTVNYWVSP